MFNFYGYEFCVGSSQMLLIKRFFLVKTNPGKNVVKFQIFSPCIYGEIPGKAVS